MPLWLPDMMSMCRCWRSSCPISRFVTCVISLVLLRRSPGWEHRSRYLVPKKRCARHTTTCSGPPQGPLAKRVGTQFATNSVSSGLPSQLLAVALASVCAAQLPRVEKGSLNTNRGQRLPIYRLCSPGAQVACLQQPPRTPMNLAVPLRKVKNQHKSRDPILNFPDNKCPGRPAPTRAAALAISRSAALAPAWFGSGVKGSADSTSIKCKQQNQYFKISLIYSATRFLYMTRYSPVNMIYFIL